MAELAVKLATFAGEQVVAEVIFLGGVRQDIQFVVDELKTLNAFLRDAEEKQGSNELTRVWVKDVRELAYDVEDCLDDFSIHLEHHGQENCLKSFARLVFSLHSLKARHRIANKIRKIESRIEEISSRRMRYGITTGAASRTEDYADSCFRQYDPRLTALFVKDTQLVGIVGPREILMGWLLEETVRQVSLIAVVGEGGLGKTTIAKKAFDSCGGQGFECCAWITVSQTCNVERILGDIIKQVIPTGSPDRMGMVQLIEKINGYLEHRRYLFVFDDMWKTDAWNSLEMVLPKNELGSRIILTTRNQEVAEVACATQNIQGHIYHPEKLSSQESMELFLKRVFINLEQITCPDDLKDVAEAILKKCDGLPLAIISIAGVLASRRIKSKQEWEKMLSRFGSELGHNPNFQSMKQILTLSYNDLPYHVRQCFLYLCKFPEDSLIGRKRIQRLWVAEGFVFSRHDMTAEEVANSYFNELANRFLIIPSDFSCDGKVKSFRVHDIILELLVSKAMEENFLSFIGKNERCTTKEVIRRLSVHHNYQQHMEQNMSSSRARSLTEEVVRVLLIHQKNRQHMIQSMKLSHVRSLTVMRGDGVDLAPFCGMLRVLDFEGCSALGYADFSSLSKLIHLKYVSLRGTSAYLLPESLWKLRNLETLDIRQTHVRMLPERIIELKRLRFLYGYHLKIPRGIGRLGSLLQILTEVDANGSGKEVIEELGNMTQLQKLVVCNLPGEWVDDFCENSLAFMATSLRSLKLKSSRATTMDSLQGLNYLSKPPLLLETLKLKGSLRRLPTWILSLTNLLRLHLRYSKLEEEDDIQSLGTLPNLIQLTMKQAFLGESLCFGARGFGRLKELNMKDHSDMKSVSFLGGVMHHLECLYLDDPVDTRILGITNLASLKELRTSYLNGRHSSLVKEQLDQHPNRPRLIQKS